MLVSADQVADTLRLLAPGFLAAKAFYLFGLRTKRSDPQWVIWSLIAAVPVTAVANYLHPGRDLPNVMLSFAIGIAGGTGFGLLWSWLVRKRPNLKAEAAIRAWDIIFSRDPSNWLQIELVNKKVVSGLSLYAGRSVDTDDLDIYVVQPQLVDEGRHIDLPGVEGLLINRSQIATITVFARAKTDPL
jgi:hypothetical protein